MSIQWDFNHNIHNQRNHQEFSSGFYRVKIDSAIETVSQSGNQMIKMTLSTLDSNLKIKHHLTFSHNNKAMVNKILCDIYSSFGIPIGNLEAKTWIGKIGAAKLEQAIFNGKPFIKVAYFLTRQQQDKLIPHPTDEEIDNYLSDLEME